VISRRLLGLRWFQHYDSDKRVPVFGFGCYLNGGTHHCLPLTMDPEDVEVDGVSGILEAYRYELWCEAVAADLFGMCPWRRQDNVENGAVVRADVDGSRHICCLAGGREIRESRQSALHRVVNHHRRYRHRHGEHCGRIQALYRAALTWCCRWAHRTQQSRRLWKPPFCPCLSSLLALVRRISAP
jgi:hypothetical protein